MARKGKQQKRRGGKERVSQAQLQAYRARQEAVLSREEVEQRRAEERRRERMREEAAVNAAEGYLTGGSRSPKDEQEDVPRLTAEQVAAEYSSVRQELYRIAIWGGVCFLLLFAVAFYMNM